MDALSFIQPILYCWTFGLSPNSTLKNCTISNCFFLSFFFCVCVQIVGGKRTTKYYQLGQPVSQFSPSVMSDFATPWTAARQAFLSITNSRSLFKLMSIELVMPCNHFILSSPSPTAFNLSQHQGLFK